VDAQEKPGETSSEMTPHVHAPVEDADDDDPMLGLAIDDEMGAVRQYQITSPHTVDPLAASLITSNHPTGVAKVEGVGLNPL
jgi:hypothetical protein